MGLTLETTPCAVRVGQLAAPLILYTDIVAGPATATGAEGGNGIYLSIFGVNFGTVIGNVSVTVGGGAVAQVIYLGKSNGRPDIQQISVQLGASCATGAIVVTVGGQASNSDQTFTVASGRMFYADNVNGADGNAGTFASPRQTMLGITNLGQSAGDFMILKGNVGTSYGPENNSAAWQVKFGGTSTTAAITLMGYPGQFPYINAPWSAAAVGQKGGVYAFDGTPANDFINVVGIKIEASGSEGAIDSEVCNFWRAVNNEITMTTAGAFGSTNAGGCGGIGNGQYWVGNHVHDTAGTSANQTHGIYVNNGVGYCEIAYNWIENINNGTGVQIDCSCQAASTPITTGNHVHHNIIHNTLKYGIEFGDYGLQVGFMVNYAAWDNLVYNTGLAGFIFNTINSNAPLTADIWNNTFYHCGSGTVGCIDNDNGSTLSISGMVLDFSNNIVIPNSGSAYFTELSSSSGLAAIPGSKNAFNGGTGSTLGTSPITATLSFVSPPPTGAIASGGALPDMNLAGGSAGIGAGSTSTLTGNGAPAQTFLPAFGGVLNDLNIVTTPSPPNVGATQGSG